jgi:hypothetical protein
MKVLSFQHFCLVFFSQPPCVYLDSTWTPSPWKMMCIPGVIGSGTRLHPAHTMFLHYLDYLFIGHNMTTQLLLVLVRT